MRPYAASVCGLKLLVYEALSYLQVEWGQQLRFTYQDVSPDERVQVA